MENDNAFKENLAKLAAFTEATSIWKPADVKQEPETILSQWRVYKVKGNFDGEAETTHFVGYTLGRFGEGRVCSPVLEYDPETRQGITRSGRVYKLHGSSGFNRDAMYVWNRWLGMAGDPEYIDVTEEYDRG